MRGFLLIDLLVIYAARAERVGKRTGELGRGCVSVLWLLLAGHINVRPKGVTSSLWLCHPSVRDSYKLCSSVGHAAASCTAFRFRCTQPHTLVVKHAPAATVVRCWVRSSNARPYIHTFHAFDALIHSPLGMPCSHSHALVHCSEHSVLGVNSSNRKPPLHLSHWSWTMHDRQSRTSECLDYYHGLVYAI